MYYTYEKTEFQVINELYLAYNCPFLVNFRHADLSNIKEECHTHNVNVEDLC